MTPEDLATYKARHPNEVLLTPSFSNAAAALNALFDRDLWECDSDVDELDSDESIDIDSKAGTEALSQSVKGARTKKEDHFRWRAPSETLRGPCTLWRETMDVTPNAGMINAVRVSAGPPPLRPEDPELQPRSYTVYKLVCEVDQVTDADMQVLQRLADRHNLALGFQALWNMVLIQLAFVR